MARLVWDQVGERYYEMGDRQTVLYPMNAATRSYESGVAWNGVTAFNESPDGGENQDLWADDIKYASFRSAENLNASLEAYTYPDEFAECDGSAAVATGVYIHQQKRKAFGLCVRTSIGNDLDDEVGYKLHLLYGCTASPSEKSHATINDSPDAETFSWDISTVPVTVGTINGVDYKPTAKVTIDSRNFNTPALKAKLKALEDVLYGTESTEPRLPSVAEVIAIVSGSTEVAGVGVAPSTLDLNVGDVTFLTATLYPSGAHGTITWTSSTESVATVEDGLVTAVAAGSTTITATCNGKSDTCVVTVTE